MCPQTIQTPDINAIGLRRCEFDGHLNHPDPAWLRHAVPLRQGLCEVERMLQHMTPKDHIERFRLLEVHFPQHYRTIDKYFGVYRDTYSLFIEKEKCNEVRKHVDTLIKEQSIER